MKRMYTVVVVIVIATIVTLILAALFRGIGFSVERLRGVFDTLDPQTGIILGMSSLVALLSAWLISAAIRSATRREIESRWATERVHLYEAVLKSLAARSSRPSDERLTPASSMLLKACVPVLKEYRLLLGLLSDANAGEEPIRLQAHRLLVAMRRDSGSSTVGLENEDGLEWLPLSVPAKSVQAIHNGPSVQRPNSISAPAHRLSARV